MPMVFNENAYEDLSEKPSLVVLLAHVVLIIVTTINLQFMDYIVISTVLSN